MYFTLKTVVLIKEEPARGQPIGEWQQHYKERDSITPMPLPLSLRVLSSHAANHRGQVSGQSWMGIVLLTACGGWLASKYIALNKLYLSLPPLSILLLSLMTQSLTFNWAPIGPLSQPSNRDDLSDRRSA